MQNAAGAGALQPAEAPAVVDRGVRSTLRVHRKAFEAQAAKGAQRDGRRRRLPRRLERILTEAPDADDDRADASEDEVPRRRDAAMEAATATRRWRGVAGRRVHARARRCSPG